MTLVGTEPIPVEVQVAIDPEATRSSLLFAGNVSADVQRQLRTKLGVLLDAEHVTCDFGTDHWLKGCRTTVAFEPSDTPIGPEVEAAVLVAIYEQLPFGVAEWAHEGVPAHDGERHPVGIGRRGRRPRPAGIHHRDRRRPATAGRHVTGHHPQRVGRWLGRAGAD